ncbi:MAG TPA: Asp-tRNA(Asn)/Glu-tRNA(Gln) amidotransferase subunit GatB [Casimicrobiaceae bacterium]|nr:Asp-tRNA(Asn)/Glu-tRNA(Gln) amidotransferase subunit GatB [Casimicrobiaceae bacterium]
MSRAGHARTGWEVVVGIETHVQLSTASKMFSGASTAFGAAPNVNACAVDLALPGVLPVPNRGAIERALAFGLAIGGTINRESVFARKNYFYPDLPKGYQISQYERPIVTGGALSIASDDGERSIRLTRAHLEEDAGKSLHEGLPQEAEAAVGRDGSGIDLNRAGTPLLEIVSEPDLRSAAEAAAYARRLHAFVTWIGICDGNLQEGSFRCDANVSVRREGAPLGTRCEIKNLNSFRFLELAIDYEARRQIELIEDGGSVRQETRLYDAGRNETRPMRSKEDAQDYRYFPDPDLPPLAIDEDWIERVRTSLPELPDAVRARLVTEHGITHYDAQQLTASRELAEYYERAAAALPAHDAAGFKLVANWVLGEFSAARNRDDVPIERAPVAPALLADILRHVTDGTISVSAAKTLFNEMWNAALRGATAGNVIGIVSGLVETGSATASTSSSVDAMIESLGLRQVSDVGELEALVDAVIAAQSAVVAEFRGGREKAFNALVGQVMKASRGKANPGRVSALLKAKLERSG